ncbi:MAG: ATP phosphoribosyltransferase regulatory subunit [Rhodospirillaceae bacterium]|jgi:ATP phosphoribosyltransferase regulatory subunit|nr:ATP phosphoribosyltransferase regulatory subunit [Rhodospirillaceae bacterium]
MSLHRFNKSALLPAGLYDILPPQAAHEANVEARLMANFFTHGYECVKPPLIEFEESLIYGHSSTVSEHIFRVMDPMTQRMMGIRSDMTLQIARIATTQLINVARPLRLSYSGQVLRLKGNQLRPERQFGQAGIELIGVDSATADAEIIVLITKSLIDLGIDNICVDLILPSLISEICIGLDNIENINTALDHKDSSIVSTIGGDVGQILNALIEAVGPATSTLVKLSVIPLPEVAKYLLNRLTMVVDLIVQAVPELILTIDPVERRGFEYHNGVGFTVFKKGSVTELGRGGRYSANGESAVGATLFMNTVQNVIPHQIKNRRVFIPIGTSIDICRSLRSEGWVTIAGLEQVDDDKREAMRMSCSHFLLNGLVTKIN